MTSPAHRPSWLSAFQFSLALASILCLSSIKAADASGYLRRSGPSPIRFQLAPVPAPSSPFTNTLDSTNALPQLSTVPDQTPAPLAGTDLPDLSATNRAGPTDDLILQSPGIPNPSTDPAGTNTAFPVPIPSEPNTGSATLIQESPNGFTPRFSPENPAPIIEPQTIIPLFLDFPANSARVTVVTPLTFTPPQPYPVSRSTATYSVTP